ncbi:alpha/beta hydrolases superfamily protein [Tanacetum coccineum]|uniref:Alpha/beta hydrolases superfamily protein n=1 Tax=Tanacetum coccineum TaxID=301880 RepID=A0ABQ5IML8_9ASTR
MLSDVYTVKQGESKNQDEKDDTCSLDDDMEGLEDIASRAANNEFLRSKAHLRPSFSFSCWKMIKKGLDPDRSTYISLINGHVSQENMKEAFRYHDQMLQRGIGDKEVVVGEGVVVTSSSLEMLTNSCLGGIMVSLIFLEGLEDEALVEFMVELFEEDEDGEKSEKDGLFNLKACDQSGKA